MASSSIGRTEAAVSACSRALKWPRPVRSMPTLYVDATHKSRYAIDLRTGKAVGPLKSNAQIIGPSFVAIP